VNDAGRIAHAELKYKDHIEGSTWTAMRGLEPRTGVATPLLSGGRDLMPAESQELANCKKGPDHRFAVRPSGIACV
jgi:hypothetical protein